MSDDTDSPTPRRSKRRGEISGGEQVDELGNTIGALSEEDALAADRMRLKRILDNLSKASITATVRNEYPELSERAIREINLQREIDRHDSKRDFQRWLSARPGDDDAFAEVDWDKVDPEQETPTGADGIFPETGIVWGSGRYGSGKTILAYWTALQRVRAGWRVAVCEAEMGESRVMGLLQNLGATDDEIRRFHYLADPDGGIPDLVANGRALARKAKRLGARMVIFDSVIAFLAASGLDENSPTDIRNFVNTTGRPIADNDGLAYFIDHTGHDNDRARGSSDKPGAGDFIFVVGQSVKFARGKSGQLRLAVSKDRSGKLPDGSAMLINVHAELDGSLELEPDIWLTGTETDGAGDSPTRDKIVELIGANGGPMAVGEIAALTGWTASKARTCLNRYKGSTFLQTGQGKWDTAQ